MGQFFYGSEKQGVEFDDRALYHLQTVIVAKLRRKESLLFSWTIARDNGGGRNSVWLDPRSTLHFRYNGSRVPALNMDWINQLMLSANSSNGLFFTPESEPATQIINPVRGTN